MIFAIRACSNSPRPSPKSKCAAKMISRCNGTAPTAGGSPAKNFPRDAANAQAFIKLLAGLRVAEFVKDVVTAPDLETYGLASPRRRIILRSLAGDTNAVIAQLLFGTNQTGEVFVKRADKDFIYGVALADFNRLPEAGWEFRDRRIWNFSETTSRKSRCTKTAGRARSSVTA